LCKYAGGKTYLAPAIVDHLLRLGDYGEYREPFAGGCSVGIEYLCQRPDTRVWFNDLDVGMVALMQTVAEKPDQLKQMVQEFEPSPAKFKRLRKQLLSPTPLTTIDRAFKTLAVQTLSFSGKGVMGGFWCSLDAPSWTRSNEWWPDYRCRVIDDIHPLFAAATISGYDFEYILNANALLYCDPPYISNERGTRLYRHIFTQDDHVRLMRCLKRLPNPNWLVSYDDRPEVRSLYRWATIRTIDTTHSIGKNQSHAAQELLISRD